MKKLIILFLISASIFALSCDDSNYDYGALAIRAQSGSLFWKYTYSGTQTIASEEEGGYYLSAAVSYNDDNSLFSKKGIALIKFNSSRDVVWHKFYPITVDYNRVIIQKENNNIYLCSSNNRNIQIIKHDINGNIILKKSIGIEGIDRVESLESFIASDNGFLVGGNSNDTQNSNNNCSFIIKIDLNGNILWSKKYNFEYLSSLAYKNNIIYAVSKTSSIMTTDTEGNFISAHNFNTTAQFANTRIITTTDGIILGSKQDGNLLVMKILDDFSVAWQFTIGGQYDEGVTSLMKTSDNNLLITSMTISYKGSSSANNTNNIWAIKCNITNGAVQWQKVYDLKGDSPSSTLENEKGYLITGSYNNFNGENKAIMFQIDPQGDLPGYNGKFMIADTPATQRSTSISFSQGTTITVDNFNISISEAEISGKEMKSDVSFL